MSAFPPHSRDDDWLAAHADLVAAATEMPILELGCGDGRDTAWLCGRHPHVVACDLSQAALAACAMRAPSASCVRLDLGRPLPFRDEAFALIVASLSLHYFAAAHTHAVIAEVRRCLAPRGYLICRVNSVRDAAFGARGHPEIAPHFYAVRDRTKRFFDAADLDAFFGAAFSCLARTERTIDHYWKPKVAWELRLRKG